MIAVLIYGSECLAMSSKLKTRFEATEMGLYKRMLRVPWSEYVSNNDILEKKYNRKGRLDLISERGSLNF